MSKMITRKSWDIFYKTGLLMFINQFLHIFGWAIVFCFDDKTKKVTDVYPARVKFRGFDYKATEKSYKKVSKYMHKNSKILLKEVEE